MKSLELKIPPVLMVLISVLLMYLLQDFYPLSWFDGRVGLALLLLLVLAGTGVTFYGVVSVRQARTTLNPLTPDKTTYLVTSGAFAHSRNPIYLGLALILAGIAFWCADLTSFLVLALFIRFISRYQIIPEENVLLGKFGELYEAYCNRVPRWM